MVLSRWSGLYKIKQSYTLCHVLVSIAQYNSVRALLLKVVLRSSKFAQAPSEINIARHAAEGSSPSNGALRGAAPFTSTATLCRRGREAARIRTRLSCVHIQGLRSDPCGYTLVPSLTYNNDTTSRSTTITILE